MALLEIANQRQGLGEEAYQLYTELRKLGGAPHGGYWIGFERHISWLGGIENVRECIPMPRWSGRMLLWFGGLDIGSGESGLTLPSHLQHVLHL